MSDFNVVSTGAGVIVAFSGAPIFDNVLEEGELEPGQHGLVIGDESTTGLLVIGTLDELRTFAASIVEEVDAAIAEKAEGKALATGCWTCPGCHRRIDETQADMIIDHVRDCDLVDGAGHPLGG